MIGIAEMTCLYDSKKASNMLKKITKDINNLLLQR